VSGNKTEILKALQALVEPGSVAELRVIGCKDGNYTANYTGYFDDLEKMAEAAAGFDGQAPAVYLTLHKCNPALLARAANRVVKSGKTSVSTSDHDVEKFCWLPIDADAKRPAGISSSESEHAAAIERIREIRKKLLVLGWPEPVAGDSGNGGHLLFKIDLPNTAENVELIKAAILALHQEFSDAAVEIDRTVFNPARIWKLYGTLTKKGDPTPDRPHRRARLLNVPAEIVTVPVEKIKELAAKAKAETPKPAFRSTAAITGDGIDPADWCRKHGLILHHDASWKDGQKYQLTPCPFNDAHREAIIIKHPSGAVSFKCLHNGCAGKTWRDLREMLEPAALRQPAPKSIEPPKAQLRPSIDPRIDVDKDLSEMFDELAAQERGERITLPLPWRRLSDGSNALKPGTMTILAGPLKTGKSFFTMNIIRHIAERGHSWAYLPLEDDRKAWSWRMLALLAEDYRMINADQEGVSLRANALATWQERLSEYLRQVTENPRVGVRNSLGETIVPEVTHHRVLGWIARAAKTCRVIVVDPISQIEFKGRDPWAQESEFVRNALGIISDTDASLILVAHTVKRTGQNASVALTAEDVAGSAMYTRLAHTTILIDACDMREIDVMRTSGGIETVTHDRIVTIAAARNGSASRRQLAYLQDKNKPHFEELGFIAPAKKKGKK